MDSKKNITHKSLYNLHNILIITIVIMMNGILTPSFAIIIYQNPLINTVNGTIWNYTSKAYSKKLQTLIIVNGRFYADVVEHLIYITVWVMSSVGCEVDTAITYNV